jgi:hypothetical protein
MREKDVPHRHLDLLGARSITELEMWLYYRGLTTPGDVALLVREGYLIDLGKGPTLTPKGLREQASLAAEREARKSKKKRRGETEEAA